MSDGARDATSGTMDDDLRVRLYQARGAHDEMRALAEERDEACRNLAAHDHTANPSVLGKHARQFYWTVTRALGLGHLHDGSRRHATNVSATPSVHLIPVARPAPRKDGPRILMDVTGTAFHDVVSGIPRFVREIAKEAYASGDALPVVNRAGALWTIYDGLDAQQPVPLTPGDVLYVPDIHPQWIDTYRALRSQGARLVVHLHDAIPLTHPTTCMPGFPAEFARWFGFVAAEADAIVTSSRSAARDVAALLPRFGVQARAIPISSAPNATSIAPLDRPPSPALAQALASGRCFVMVGTLEPRKGHVLALDAFDLLWARGVAASLLIIGHPGWSTRHVERRIAANPRHQRSLFWLTNADDDDLAQAYANCAAVLVPSLAEGFGLPLIEASAFGAHRIASDIPVLREVAGERDVTFVPVCDVEALAAAIEFVPPRDGTARRGTPQASWADASARLFATIRTQGEA